MRINILQAGLATYMLAGHGFLPKDDSQPAAPAPASTITVPPKPVAKDEQH